VWDKQAGEGDGVVLERQQTTESHEKPLHLDINKPATVRSARLFCSVLWLSSVRRLVTPPTYFLHLSLSSVSLTDSFTESPVHVLMLSIQAVGGLPHLRVCVYTS